MDPLVWFVVVALVLVVLHVAVAAYLYRSATADSSASGTDEYLPVDSSEPRERSSDADDDRVACGTCGTPNDPSYRFCRQCVADLTSGDAGINGPGSTERLGS